MTKNEPMSKDLPYWKLLALSIWAIAKKIIPNLAVVLAATPFVVEIIKWLTK